MLMIPFELRAKLEYVKRGKHGYWHTDEPFWLAYIAERAPGLPSSTYVPVEIPGNYTREDAQIFASGQWALKGIKAKWRKLPRKRAPQSKLSKMIEEQAHASV